MSTVKTSDPLEKACLDFLSKSLYPIEEGMVGIEEVALPAIAKYLAKYIGSFGAPKSGLDRSYMEYFIKHNTIPCDASINKGSFVSQSASTDSNPSSSPEVYYANGLTQEELGRIMPKNKPEGN